MLTFETKRNEILRATGATAYRLTPESVRLSSLRDKVRQFSKIRGNALPENEVDDIARTLDNALMRYYDSLPLKEVELALEWEMITGESIRLTVHNMLRGVAKYLASEERKSALALAARNTGKPSPLTEQDVRLKDFDALLAELLSSWAGYRLTGRLDPYRVARGEAHRDGCRAEAGDALRGSQRRVYAGCYAWLRTYGVMSDDDETRRRERVCISNAVKEGAVAVGIYAEALMLEWVFSEAAKTNRDLGREINGAAGLVTEIVRMNTPLRHLKTN